MSRPKGSKNKRPYPVTEAVLAARAVRYTPERNAKIAAAQRGAGNSNWKGDEVQYGGLHTRVRVAQGRASEHLCASCLAGAQHWANVSGDYFRDVNDFIPLCAACHRWFDERSVA